MYAFLKSLHNHGADMDVQNGKKVHFLLRLNIGKKNLAACLQHSIDIVS